MGCCVSVVIPNDVDATTESRYWQPVLSSELAMSTLEADGYDSENIEISHLELRAILDYPMGREFLLRYSKSTTIPPYVGTCHEGWLDIQAYNSMTESPTKVAMARSIYDKYIKNSVLFTEDEQKDVEQHVASGQLPSTLFRSEQAHFFKLLHDNLFTSFKNSPEYLKMCSTLRKKYNRVKQNDFCYHQLIGQGGFGLVAEVSKKSTGARYAMKLQRKDQMFAMFRNEMWRINMEMRTVASCHHPFIVELSFAFQTESLLAMVTGLGTGRDLSKVLKAGGPLTVEQVRFYAAEVTSALSYLHHKGFVYRDLKPANILLDLDGHIRLIDFGGVCDVNGKVVASCKEGTGSFFSLPSEKSETTPLGRHWGERAGSVGAAGVVSTGRARRAESDGCVGNPSSNRSESVRAVRADSSGSGSGSSGGSLDDNVLTQVSTGPDFEYLRACCELSRSPGQVVQTLRRLRLRFADLSEATILRHLLASNGNYEKAVAHIEDCIAWRQVVLPLPAVDSPPCAGLPTLALNRTAVAPGCFLYTHGVDSQGHPLLIVTPRLIFSRLRDIDAVVRWWVFMLEQAIARLPPHLEQFTILANRVDMPYEVDFELGRHIFPIMDKYFPYRRHKLLIYPSSVTVRAVGGVLKSLASKQAENIHFIESLQQLRMLVPDQYIPAEMGGSCTYKFDIKDYPAHDSSTFSCEGYPRVASDYDEHADSLGGVVPPSFDTAAHLGPLSISSYVMDSSNLAAEEEAEAPRANSIVGTYHYMAPEMVVLMVNVHGFKHTGYTKAVDWWSLGVTIYRLISGAYPFHTDIPKPRCPDEVLTEGSDRFAPLVQKIDYSSGRAPADMVDFMSQLLVVDDKDRLGYGPDGSTNVSAHPFFRNINWVELEQKKSRPPPLPRACVARPKGNREFATLADLLQTYGKNDWVRREAVKSGDGTGGGTVPQDVMLANWDYASPAAVLAELEARPQ